MSFRLGLGVIMTMLFVGERLAMGLLEFEMSNAPNHPPTRVSGLPHSPSNSVNV